MRKVFLAALAAVLLPAVHAQIPAGCVQVSGTALYADSSSTLVQTGTITFAPVTSTGAPISYQTSCKAVGQTGKLPVVAPVAAGAFTLLLPDTTLTKPANLCFSVTAKDTKSGNSLLGPGYTCFQPHTIDTGRGDGCANSICNFDAYPPNLAALVTVQSGPQGTKGDTGSTGATGATGPMGSTGAQGASTITGMSGDGAGNATLTGKLTAGIVAATGAVLGSTRPVTTVGCAGTNDNVAINAALTTSNKVVLVGDCILNPAAGRLTIQSNTYLDASKASITYNPTTAGDPIITNTQNAQTVQRSFSDAVATAGSNQLTSATGAFTQSDVGKSIMCLNAFGAGGATYWAPTVGSDLHTSIANFTSATSITLADPPQASVNPATCSIYVRDTNITIDGGNWSLGGQATGTSAAMIKIKTANNVTIKNTTTWNGPIGSTTSQNLGSFNIYILDATNVKVSNITLNGWLQGQDGVHFVGPMRDFSVDGVHGHSGDDFVAMNNAEGAGNSNAAVDAGMYGVIQGGLISNIVGSSYANEAGVKFAGLITGNPMPTRDVSIFHVHGTPYTCSACQSANNRPGFGDAVLFIGGQYDGILAQDISGAYLQAPVQITGIAAGTITIKDVSQSFYSFSTNKLVSVLAGTWTAPNSNVISNLDISGLRGDTYNAATDVLVDRTSSVGRIHIHDIQHGNMTGGAFTPIVLQGTFDDILLDNFQLMFTSGNATPAQGIFNLYGAIANHLSADHLHVTYGAGAVSGGVGVFSTMALQPGNFIPAIGDIALNDIVVNGNGTAFNEGLYYQPGGAGTLNSFTLANSHLSNLAGCLYGSIPSAAATVSNITSASLGGYAASCANWSPGTPVIVGTPVTLTNQTATIAQTTFYTSTSAAQLLRADCSLYTGSTTGTGTVTGMLVWNSGATYFFTPAMTLAASTTLSFSQVFVQTALGGTVKYAANYTAGTGGSYNLTCAVTRLQ